ncbi:helix-turn-helix domain-containing protein [Micromonospora aurantiaca (nom. illeg.)]|uniref:helix-turn-helix domain-containing protein n=1 Tax=Micromonospora aurantiaca (nom. illeg.) TaxID=47850 RepID=UPI000828F283|nr:helix-turn-helix domain-containing protein [Micromonospora aurantiaca]SCL42168.1 Helix-turn-helix domain-containing protein [Micromonospora aurantiaca]
MSDLTRYAGGAAAVKDALRASHDLKPTERLVLVAIVAHANADGDAWPSVATIADYVGCSERTVQRALRRLVEVGRLLVRKVANIATRVYRLVVGGGDKQAAGGDIPAREGDALRVTQRSVEDHSEDVKPRAARTDWRRFLPKSKNPNTAPRPYPYAVERRGAALPPPRDAERCSRHIGQTAAHCSPCRSEALGGAR